jgi:hypothetical protein
MGIDTDHGAACRVPPFRRGLDDCGAAKSGAERGRRSRRAGSEAEDHGGTHRAGLSVNRELVLLYWAIGCDILGRQEREGWGAKVIDLLAGDLGKAFPEMTGLSARNLKYMRAFAKAWGP